MKLFGKKKMTTPVKSVNDVIQDLNTVLETFDKKETFLSKQYSDMTKEAAAFLKTGNKNKAVFALRKRKLLEKRLDYIGNQRMNIEVQKNALIQAVDNKYLVNVMKNSNAVLKCEEIDIDEVEQVVDSAQEQIAQIAEVSDALSRPIGEVVDEDELMTEFLEQLESTNQSVVHSIERPTVVHSFPDVPVKKTVKDQDDERELKELDQLMLS